MNYAIPIDFQYESSSKTLPQEQKNSLLFPNKTIIRIFGTIGSGKGTISQLLSHHLSLPSIDSGTIWRAVAYGYNESGAKNSAENTSIIFGSIKGEIVENALVLYYKNKKLSLTDLKNPTIDSIVSQYSHYRENYNTFVSQLIKSIDTSLIIDGRGGNPPYINSAEQNGFKVIRIFLFSSISSAVQRRFLDYKDSSNSLSQEELKTTIRTTLLKRETQDYTHIMDQNLGWVNESTFALDTSNLTIDQVFDTVLFHISTQI